MEFTANEAGRARLYDYSQINFPPAVFAAEENVFNQWGYIDTYSFGYTDGNGLPQIAFPFVDSDSIINKIITMNHIYDIKDRNNVDRSKWSDRDFASWEFLEDIKASKNGYLEWSGYIPFSIRKAKGVVGAGGFTDDLFVCGS